MATTTQPKPNVETPDKQEVTAEQIKKEYEKHWNYVQGSYHNTWTRAWKLYNNIRVDYGYEGKSNTFVPMTFSIVEATLANVVGGRPKLTYQPTNPEQTADVKILDAYADYIWDKSKLQLKVIPWTRDSIMYGTGVLFGYWDAKLNIPNFKNIPLKDFWIDPTATSIEDAEDRNLPCGFRYLTTRDELKRRMVVNDKYDDEVGETKKNARMVPLYNHAMVDEAADFSGETTDKEEKDTLMGSTLGGEDRKGQVEVIVRVTRDKWVEVLNRDQIIRDEANPFKMLPFAVQRDFFDTNLFYAKGHVEVIAKRQEELNDNENQDVDNMSYYLDNMFRYDPQIANTVAMLRTGPGVGIPARAGEIEFFEKPAPTGKAGEKRMEIKTDMREAVGAGEILQAGGTQTTKKTASEINATQLNAGKRFDVMLQVMENDGFQQLGRMIFKLVQLFADDKCVVRVTGGKGIRFEEFIKKDFEGEYEPKIQLEASAKTEQSQKRLEDDQMYAQLSVNPLVNQIELTKTVLQKRWNLDADEVELLLSNPNDTGEPQMGGDPNAMAQDPSMMQNPMMQGQAPGAGMGIDPNAPAAPDPTMGGKQTADGGLIPSDLVKLYAAAVTAGDYGMLIEIKTKLGFDPSDDPPIGIQQKQTTMVGDRIKHASEIQRSQIEQERIAQEALNPQPA